MISTQELADSLKLSSQRVGALTKSCNVSNDESVVRGRSRYYTRSAVKKILSHRGVPYSETKLIAISNNKGGVGKTSIATSLARRLTNLGFEVLVIDIDPQANTTGFFLDTEAKQSQAKYVLYDVLKGNCEFSDAIVQAEDGLDLVPSSLLNSRLENELSGSQKNPATFMKNLMGGLRQYNYVIFDMSPSFSQINFLCSLTADLIIIPTLLTRFSIEGVQMTVESIREWEKEYSHYKPQVRILVNQIDTRLTTQLGFGGSVKDIVASFNDVMDIDVFATAISADNTINRVQSGIVKLLPSSNFYKDIAQLSDEIVGLNRNATEVVTQ